MADVRFTLKGDNKARAIGRIAGRHGRTRLLIENVTKTRIIVANNWVSKREGGGCRWGSLGILEPFDDWYRLVLKACL